MRLHHIAVVVEDVEAALGFWRDALGLPLSHIERNEDEAVDIAFLPLAGGTGEVELIAPNTPDSGVAKYLAKRGAGLHHLCLQVEDIDATAERLRARHVELINDAPKTRPDGSTRYLFIHPRSTGGVLLELYEVNA